MHRCSVLALLVSALFAFTVPAQNEAQLLAALVKACTPPPKGKATQADKVAALAATAGLDSSRTAQELVEAWLLTSTGLAALDAQRAAANAELAVLYKGQEAAEKRTLADKAALDRANQLRAELGSLRLAADDARTLLEQLGNRIAELRRRDGTLWLLQNVCGHKKHPLQLKLAAARAVGGGAVDVLEELAAALPRAKEPEEQVVLIDALTLAGPMARTHSTPLIALLQSKQEAVAERAALALAKLAAPEAVEPMIALLERTDGQSTPRVAAALEVLTGQQFGRNVGSWKAWWQAEGKALIASGAELGKGTPSHRKETDKFYYFGIPQEDSESILYVIDCSGSMKKPIQWPGEDGKTTEISRLEACKAELIRGLERLQPGQQFAILWYNDLPHFWEPKLQAATKETVARAQAFVKTLLPAQSTNIHDSLEQCFQLVGRGAKDKAYGVEIDTIFLLTDGSPTTPDGKEDSTEKILLGVRAWNALKRVTIHCIAIGKELNESFLRQLASENGGQFKKF